MKVLVILPICFLSAAHGQDDPRNSFAFLATISPLDTKVSFPGKGLDLTFFSLYQPRCALNLRFAAQPKDSLGLISLYSDVDGYFSLEFTSPKIPYRDDLKPVDLLAKAKFQSTAVSQTQYKAQKLNSVVDSFKYAIVTMMASGHNYSVNLSYDKFQELVRSCPNDGSLSHHAKDEYTPTDITITKQNGKLWQVAIKNRKEESVGIYETPVESVEEKFTANLTIKNKDFPDGVKIRLQKQKTIVAPDQIQTVYQSVLSRIPSKTKLLLNDKDEQIPREWDGMSFRPVTIPESIQKANEQRLANRKTSWTTYVTIIVALIAGAALLLFWLGRKRVATASMVLLVMSVSAQAQTADGPYCGIYCVKAAAAAMGQTVEFEELRQRKYLSANPGSTTTDLINALELAQLKGIPKRYLSVSQLRMTDHPVILHARSPGATNFKHWILFLGFTEYGKVSVYDPPFAQREISLAELLAVWDGFGIEVSDRSTSSITIVSWDWIAIAFVAGCVYLALRKKWSAGISVPVCSFLLAMIWCMTPQGVLGKTRALGLISANYFPRQIPEIDIQALKSIQEKEELVLVDARNYEGFIKMRIPGSINVPANAGLIHLHEAMGSIPVDRQIVCFCNSETCGWADSVANQLSHMGYRRIAIYRGGMRDWMEHQQTVDR